MDFLDFLITKFRMCFKQKLFLYLVFALITIHIVNCKVLIEKPENATETSLPNGSFEVCASDNGSVIIAAESVRYTDINASNYIYKIYYSSDFGRTWHTNKFWSHTFEVPISDNANKVAKQSRPLCPVWETVLCSPKADYILARRKFSGVYISTDFGKSWNRPRNGQAVFSSPIITSGGHLLSIHIRMNRNSERREVLHTLIRRSVPKQVVRDSSDLAQLSRPRARRYNGSLPLCAPQIDLTIHESELCQLPFISQEEHGRDIGGDVIHLSIDRNQHLYAYLNCPSVILPHQQINTLHHSPIDKNHSIFRSTDQGFTWQEMTTLPWVNHVTFDQGGGHGFAYNSVSVHKRLHEKQHQVVGHSEAITGLYYSLDSGAMWHNSTVSPALKGNELVTSHTQDYHSGRSVAFVTSLSRLFVSLDYGQHFSLRLDKSSAADKAAAEGSSDPMSTATNSNIVDKTGSFSSINKRSSVPIIVADWTTTTATTPITIIDFSRDENGKSEVLTTTI